MIHFKHGTIFQALNCTSNHPSKSDSFFVVHVESTWVYLDVTWMLTNNRTGAFHQGMWANGKTTACMVGEGAEKTHISMENLARCKKKARCFVFCKINFC